MKYICDRIHNGLLKPKLSLTGIKDTEMNFRNLNQLSSLLVGCVQAWM